MKSFQKSHLVYMDYFRGVAMLMIVAGHSYNNWKIDNLLEMSIVNTITGGTALFVFISGFFFHSVFYKNFNFKKFLQKKAVNVLIPYVILSSLAIVLGLIVKGVTNYPIELSSDTLLNNIYGSVLNLLTGNTLLAYWFIPFIILIFLASPLFIWFIKQQRNVQAVLLVIFFCLSILVHRPDPNVSPIHAFLYFISFYLFGIVYSQNREKIDSFIGKNISLAVLMLMLVGATVYMGILGQVGNLGKSNILDWNGIDLMVIQKVLLILFLLSALRKIEHISLPALQFIASISFAIFFVHTWVFSLLQKVYFGELQHGFWGFIAFFTLTIGITVIATLIVKRVLGARSRYLIGW